MSIEAWKEMQKKYEIDGKKVNLKDALNILIEKVKNLEAKK